MIYKEVFFFKGNGDHCPFITYTVEYNTNVPLLCSNDSEKYLKDICYSLQELMHTVAMIHFCKVSTPMSSNMIELELMVTLGTTENNYVPLNVGKYFVKP